MPAARTFRVRVRGDSSGASGTLVVESADSETSEREIAGPYCAAVTEALAVMVAVAIDPRAGAPSAEHERHRQVKRCRGQVAVGERSQQQIPAAAFNRRSSPGAS
jgi:hypothetical protein